jgi:hypothetical protein
VLIRAYMISCPAREQLRAATIASLKAGGWLEAPVVCLEDRQWELPLHRHMALVRSALELARHDVHAQMILFLEDDVIFNRHFRQNLEAWQPLREHRPGDHFFASLFNPGVRFLRSDPARACAEAKPDSVWGSQALLIARRTVQFFATCWGSYSAFNADIKLARLAAKLCPILFHQPSLVQHVGKESCWGGPFLNARDFRAEWRSPARSGAVAVPCDTGFVR